MSDLFQQLRNVSSIVTQDSIDDMCSSLSKIMIDAAKTACTYKELKIIGDRERGNRKRKSPPRFDKECVEKIKEHYKMKNYLKRKEAKAVCKMKNLSVAVYKDQRELTSTPSTDRFLQKQENRSGVVQAIKSDDIVISNDVYDIQDCLSARKHHFRRWHTGLSARKHHFRRWSNRGWNEIEIMEWQDGHLHWGFPSHHCEHPKPFCGSVKGPEVSW